MQKNVEFRFFFKFRVKKKITANASFIRNPPENKNVMRIEFSKISSDKKYILLKTGSKLKVTMKMFHVRGNCDSFRTIVTLLIIY